MRGAATVASWIVLLSWRDQPPQSGIIVNQSVNLEDQLCVAQDQLRALKLAKICEPCLPRRLIRRYSGREVGGKLTHASTTHRGRLDSSQHSLITQWKHNFRQDRVAIPERKNEREYTQQQESGLWATVSAMLNNLIDRVEINAHLTFEWIGIRRYEGSDRLGAWKQRSTRRDKDLSLFLFFITDKRK